MDGVIPREDGVACCLRGDAPPDYRAYHDDE